MATIRLPYVDKWRDHTGVWRYYFRKGHGKRIPLPGRPGDPEFMAAYALACETTGDIRAARAAHDLLGSVNALAVSYYQSARFMEKSAATRTTYRGILDRFRESLDEKGRVHGSKQINGLERHHVMKVIAASMQSSGPHAANNLLKVLRDALDHAVELGWVKENAARGVRRIRAKSEGFKDWSEDQIAAYEKHYPSGTRERLAMALLLYTGQRRGNAVKMGRQDRSGDTIRVRQVKTDARLVIPMHPALKRELDKLPQGDLTYLLTTFGKPYSAAGFGNWFREVVDAVPTLKGKGLSAHGLRKSVARRMAEAGCTVHQIAAVGGWKTLKEVERYTRAAEQARMAREAIEKLAE
jgi:integrase